MSLTSVMDDKSSALRGFVERELPNTRSLRAAYRAKFPTSAECVLPATTAGERPAWGTLGAAIDHRLRLALCATIHRDRSVGAGVMLAGRAHEALQRVGEELLDALEKCATQHSLDDRTRPLTRSQTVEDRLARLCYAAAWFEEVFRTGRMWPTTPLGQAHSALTLDELLDQVPAYAVADIRTLVARAEHGLAMVREVTPAHAMTLAPTFAGSAEVGGADADWIAGDLLVDVKSTKSPTTLPLTDIYQLAGYVLLDYHDTYRIQQVGWYQARSAALVTWPLEDFFRLLGARQTVSQLRAATAALFPGTGSDA